MKKIIIVALSIIIVFSLVSCESETKNTIKSYDIKAKEADSDIIYDVKFELDDQTFAEQITVALELSGETKRIIGMSKLNTMPIMKAEEGYEAFFSFGEITSKAKMKKLIENCEKEAKLIIIE